MKRRRIFLLALCATMLAAPARALDSDAPPAPDPERPAVGVWIGTVSWNDPTVAYVWTIQPDDTFTSSRLGRGQDGGGAWSLIDERLTLKYGDGFRYEGELDGDAYTGTACHADGEPLGTFAMSRDGKRYEND